METGNRFERDPAQQAQQARGDTGVPGQWSNPASSQGQGEDRQGKFMRRIHCFLLYCTVSGTS